ncbi:glycoside hydrolase family 19 protein [Pseudomonas farsensis]|uniref:Glycoside hydrolase family 19 protein n=1 Tax=Pseudomonas farsensis TaxID=2745492 RepID=A0ABU8QN69_9PSED
MTPITEQQLLQILPKARPVAGIFLPALNRAALRWKIDSRVRMAAFLAQIGHESGQLRNLVENLNYSAEALVRTWPTRLTSQSAGAYARQPEKIANRVYGGRMGNGPESSGDGWRFRGRGLIQLTGRDNYRAAGLALGLPLVEQPELLEQAEYAAQSAAWWWAQHGLNELADAGRIQDIGSVINTGQPGRVPNGAAERKALYDLALRVLA